MIARIRNVMLASLLVMTGAAATNVLGTANAQDITESHINAAKATLAASRATAGFDVLLPNMGENLKQQLISSRPDAADQISIIIDEATIGLAPRRGDLESEIARAYASIFSEDQLIAITDFYVSDAGQKLIQETPAISTAMTQASRVWSTGVERDLRQAVREKFNEAGIE